jgi:hypothetical protein
VRVWFIPPIVVPAGLALAVLAYAVLRTLATA